jgi:hypothetical protein
MLAYTIFIVSDFILNDILYAFPHVISSLFNRRPASSATVADIFICYLHLSVNPHVLLTDLYS